MLKAGSSTEDVLELPTGPHVLAEPDKQSASALGGLSPAPGACDLDGTLSRGKPARAAINVAHLEELPGYENGVSASPQIDRVRPVRPARVPSIGWTMRLSPREGFTWNAGASSSHAGRS